MARALQRFYVGLKAFIVRDEKLLMLREANAQARWELPGGRFDVGEEERAHGDVLQREITEELGPKFRCRIGAPYLTWVRPISTERGEYTFLVGYWCDQPTGEITLSDEHREQRWVGRDESLALALAPGFEDALSRFWRRLALTL